MNFIELHEKLIANGLHGDGLCYEPFNDRLLWLNNIFSMFFPSTMEADNIGHWGGHWGCLLSDIPDNVYNDFRQNIILLCAAINGEL